MSITREDIRKGMQALVMAIGPEKAQQFLRLVSSGALDQYFPTAATAWLRQNPELVEAGTKIIGTLLGTLLSPTGKGPKAVEVIAHIARIAQSGGAAPEQQAPIPIEVKVQ